MNTDALDKGADTPVPKDSLTLASGTDAPPEDPADAPEPTRSRWSLSRWVWGLVLIVLGGYFLFLYSYPVVINYPGPTFDVLGKDSKQTPLIEVKGAKTYPNHNGQLRMTTVSSLGGPGSMVSGWDLIMAAFNPNATILPVDVVYPRNVSSKDIKKLGVQQMDQSQLSAEAVALETLGYNVKITWSVAEIAKKSPAFGVLHRKDVVRTIARPGQTPVTVHTVEDLRKFLEGVPGGDTIELGIVRDGQAQTVRMKTAPAKLPKGKIGKGSQLSIYLASDVKIPLDITFHLQDVGGPSAGTMFALGIVEQLTPEHLTGKSVIAGTGTIDLAGKVGPISGIAQKMAGAKADGAKFFLAPTQNCDEVVGHIPKGLTVTKIGTFSEALDAVQKIRDGKTSDLPQCTVPAQK
ncbi:YlbL family protein [Mobiluncus curtisii]|uniref:YlbL family protein n=1 Tax=Mobiluncus curtisii TaxID=2051 RepID=UPI00146FE771|nr:S16 family serine protease [Mobiluncus curtisii]NMW88590.1 peptidase S16 [Mobiluncus curtisii]